MAKNQISADVEFQGLISQSPGAGANNSSSFAQYGDLFSDAILSGLTTTTSATLTGTLAAGVAYVLGQRVAYAGGSYTVGPSATSYLDLSNTGVLAVSTSATVTANSLRLATVTSSATAITGVDNITPTQPGVPDAAFPKSMVNLGQLQNGSIVPTISLLRLGVVDDPTGMYISANTTALINALENSSEKYSVWLPPSAFIVVDTIALSKAISLRLDGTIQMASSVNNYLMLLSGSGNHIYGSGTLDGNSSGQSTAGGGIGCASGGVSNSLLENITIQHTFNWPIDLTNITNVNVRKLSMINSGNSPQFRIAAANSSIDSCLISNIGDGGFAFYEDCTDCSATNNIVTGCTNAGISVYLDNNTESPSSVILISGNRISGNKSSAVAVATATASTSPTNNRVLITGNICSGNNTAGLSGSADIQLSSSTLVDISANYLLGNGSSAASGEYAYGVFIDANSSFVTVKDNVIGNVGSSAANGGCVFIDGATDCTIENNTGLDNQAASTTNFVVKGTPGTGCNISGNRHIGTLTGIPLQIDSVNSPVISNQDNGYGAFEFTMPLTIPKATFSGDAIIWGQADSLYQSSLLSISSTTTAGAITATASQLAGQYLADGATQTAAFTATTDTAANILAAMPNAVVGTAFKWRFINNDQSATGYAGTLAGGTGVTVGTILPNPAVPKGGYADYVFTFTAIGSAPTLTVEAVGGNSAALL